MYHKEFTVLLIDDLNSTTCSQLILHPGLMFQKIQAAKCILSKSVFHQLRSFINDFLSKHQKSANAYTRC